MNDSYPVGAGAGLCGDGTLASPVSGFEGTIAGNASVTTLSHTSPTPTDNDLAHSATAIASISARAAISHSTVAESAGAPVDAACALSESVRVADERCIPFCGWETLVTPGSVTTLWCGSISGAMVGLGATVGVGGGASPRYCSINAITFPAQDGEFEVPTYGCEIAYTVLRPRSTYLICRI